MLLETQDQFKTTEETLHGFESRKRQLERAEQRLARAEALALGIRATVETLTAQKTVVDHAMESAGALGFQMKQAEALIGALRRERDLACDLKAAVASLAEEDEERANAPSGTAKLAAVSTGSQRSGPGSASRARCLFTRSGRPDRSVTLAVTPAVTRRDVRRRYPPMVIPDRYDAV